MKKHLSLGLLLLCVLGLTYGQRGVRIGYVDMEYILENVEEYREATAQLNAKADKWKKEIEDRLAKLEQMKEDLEAEKVLLTNELIAEREEEIRFVEAEIIDYQQDRFGPRGDLVLQKELLIQPIQDQVFTEVQKIGANKRYDFIFDKSADVVMLYSEKRHDISNLVLREIGRTRKISASKKKQEMQQRLKEYKEGEEATAEVSEEIKARQASAEAAKTDKEKKAEARRAEQLKLREERKKAYEERRKKLLEEREAKRKAKLEERMKNEKGEQPKDTTNQKGSGEG